MTVLGGAIVVRLMPGGGGQPSFILLVAGLLPLHGIGFGVFLLLAVKALGSDLWDVLGLKGIPRRNVVTQFILAIPISFFFLIMGLLISQACVIILDLLGLPSPPPALFDFMCLDRPVLAAAALLSVTVLAPVSEEVLFRFGCFEFLKSWHIPGPGIWVAGIFALIHGQLFAIPALFFLSLVLQASRVRGHGLWFPIFIHGFYNLFAALFFTLAQSINSGLSSP